MSKKFLPVLIIFGISSIFVSAGNADQCRELLGKCNSISPGAFYGPCSVYGLGTPAQKECHRETYQKQKQVDHALRCLRGCEKAKETQMCDGPCQTQ